MTSDLDHQTQIKRVSLEIKGVTPLLSGAIVRKETGIRPFVIIDTIGCMAREFLLVCRM